MTLSIVIPVYNEVDSLPTLHAELDEVARRNGYDLEILFVDDGSTRRLVGSDPTSWPRADPRVRGIRFRRNFGKAAALSAGFDAARGELVITLDADLQDDPHEIPRFLAADRRGARRRQRLEAGPARPLAQGLPVARLQLDGQPADRRAAARPQLRHEVLPPRGVSTRCGSTASCTASCRCWPHARGFRVGELVINHRPRQVRPLEVRLAAVHQGLPRPADRQVPDRLRPAAAAPAGAHRPGVVLAGGSGDAVSGRCIGSSPRSGPSCT